MNHLKIMIVGAGLAIIWPFKLSSVILNSPLMALLITLLNCVDVAGDNLIVTMKLKVYICTSNQYVPQ